MTAAQLHTLIRCAGLTPGEILFCGQLAIIQIQRMVAPTTLAARLDQCGGKLYGYGNVVEMGQAQPYVMVGRLAETAEIRV